MLFHVVFLICNGMGFTLFWAGVQDVPESKGSGLLKDKSAKSAARSMQGGERVVYHPFFLSIGIRLPIRSLYPLPDGRGSGNSFIIVQV